MQLVPMGQEDSPSLGAYHEHAGLGLSVAPDLGRRSLLQRLFGQSESLRYSQRNSFPNRNPESSLGRSFGMNLLVALGVLSF